MNRLRKYFVNSISHGSVSICYYCCRMLPGHCSHECFQQPYICALSFIDQKSKAKNCCSSVVIYAYDHNKRFAINISSIGCIERYHVTKYSVIGSSSPIAPEQVSESIVGINGELIKVSWVRDLHSFQI